MLVHVVREHPDVRVPQQHFDERLQLGTRVSGAGRVRRRVQDQPFGFRRDRLVERLRLELEAALELGRDAHRSAAGQQHHVRIAHPERRRHDDLVARIERHGQRVVDHLLAAGADADLRSLVLELVLALELAHDGRLEEPQADKARREIGRPVLGR